MPGSLWAPRAKHERRGRGRMTAADHAVCRLLMTLSEQIKLWMINLDTESMCAVGFIRASLTSQAFIRWCIVTYVKGFPALEMVDYFKEKKNVTFNILFFKSR